MVTRREVLANAGRVAGGAAIVAAGAAATAQAQGQTKNLNIVVCGGHPGDPEYGCGGTVARLTDLGHAVTLMYLNQGDWPPTPADTRLAEAKKACEILKTKRAYAGQQNGHAILDNAHYDDYRKLLMAENPDIVITQWPIDNHRDHRAITNLTYDAWREAKRSFSLYYYEVSDGEDTMQFAPTHYVDISATEPRKKQACYAHASQTPDRYYELQDAVARFRGIESGYLRAEAFVFQRQSARDLLAGVFPGA
jgi:LmbE family N-acetylglucosaminyl deacetylase